MLAIVMGDEPGVSFEWPLTDLRDDRLKFEIPETDYELILQRVCDDNVNDGDVMEIRNTMMGGEWVVAKYTDDGVDQASYYSASYFAFEAEHRLNVTTGITGPVYPGHWNVLRNSDNEIKVYLNLGEEGDLGELTDDWDFVSIDANRLELRDISGGNGGVSTLIFERQ